MDVGKASSTSSAGPSPIDRLFGELHGRYGNPFLDKFRSGHSVDGKDTGIENMKRVWCDAIRAEGLTREQLRRGLAAGHAFPPSWPEFLAACRPAPDPAGAYQEALDGLAARARGEMGEWSHPAVYWAAIKLRAELQSQAYGYLKERWAAVLARQLARGEWAAIPPPRAALPAPGKGELSREHAAQMLRELRATGVLKPMRQAGDQKQWAHKLAQRAERGEALPLLSRQWLREVLGTDQQP